MAEIVSPTSCGEAGAIMTLTVSVYHGDESSDPAISVLEQLAASDTEFDFSSMVQQWRRRGCFTPRQMGLIAWRLKVHSIDHAPSDFRVSTDGEKDQAALTEMPDWKLDQLAPYLSEQQKAKFL
jgi:hypothetical protein